ncbi:MAG: hypothetical protein KGQ46_10625 [Hyphomicrobiales bacterium]|nr:hypothetical protein [Hyphomicrobiales bacterium]MDE2116054.1 hypothetical protein [Hyphomicrobiales bacterium]
MNGDDREADIRKTVAYTIEAMRAHPHILSVVEKMQSIQTYRKSLTAIGGLVRDKLDRYACENTKHFNSPETIIANMSNDFTERLRRVQALLPEGSEAEIAGLVFAALLIGPYIKTPLEVQANSEQRRRDETGFELRRKKERQTRLTHVGLSGAIRLVVPAELMRTTDICAKQYETEICKAAGVAVGTRGFSVASIKRAMTKMINGRK